MPEVLQVDESTPLPTEPPKKKQRVLVRQQHEQQHGVRRLDADSMHGGSEQQEQQSSELQSSSERAATPSELAEFVSNLPEYICIKHKKTKVEGWMSREYLSSSPRKKGIKSFYSRDPMKVPNREENAPMSSTHWLTQAGDREKSNSGHAIMVRVGNNTLSRLVDVVDAVDARRTPISPVADVAEVDRVRDEPASENPLPSSTNHVHGDGPRKTPQTRGVSAGDDRPHETPKTRGVSANDDQPTCGDRGGEELRAVFNVFSSMRTAVITVVNDGLASAEEQLGRWVGSRSKELEELDSQLVDANRQLTEARLQLKTRDLLYKDRENRLQELEHCLLAEQRRADDLEKQLQDTDRRASERVKKSLTQMSLAEITSFLQAGS